MKKHTAMRTGLIAVLTVALSATCVPGAMALAQDGAGAMTVAAAAATGDAEYKLAQTIAAFLGRHMES
mgnify:CR=1 FL=1